MKKSCFIGALCTSFCLMNLLAGPLHAIGLSGQGTWEATLQGRDLDGNLTTAEAYYDTILDITWLVDANYAGTIGYGPSYSTDGSLTWAEAKTFASGLDINGVSGWRLPNVSPVDGTTADDANQSYIGTEDWGWNISAPGTLYAGSTASAMAHLYYNTLGNKSPCDPIASTVSTCSQQTGYGMTNTGPFINIGMFYWSSTASAVDPLYAWGFHPVDGRQTYVVADDPSYSYAWVVHPGDVGVAVIPIPATTWLFTSGLLGLIGISRNKRAV